MYEPVIDFVLIRHFSEKFSKGVTHECGVKIDFNISSVKDHVFIAFCTGLDSQVVCGNRVICLDTSNQWQGHMDGAASLDLSLGQSSITAVQQ